MWPDLGFRPHQLNVHRTPDPEQRLSRTLMRAILETVWRVVPFTENQKHKSQSVTHVCLRKLLKVSWSFSVSIILR